MDVLQLHGARTGLISDDLLPGYDASGAYALRMRNLSREFRRQVVGAFARKLGFANLECVASWPPQGAAAEERMKTKIAMTEGKCMIVGGVVGDEQLRLLAMVPILLRADVAANLLHVAMREEVGSTLRNVYVAVGTKRSAVDINETGVLKPKCVERMQIEMSLWNMLLARMQGVDVGKALLVGLHSNRSKPVALGGSPSGIDGCNSIFDTSVWKMAEVEFGGINCPKRISGLEALSWRIDIVEKAEKWIHDATKTLQQNGEDGAEARGITALVKVAQDSRLRPNMKLAPMNDWPWVAAKREIAYAVRELTLVSGVSRSITSASMANGLPNDYESPRVTAETLGVSSHFTKTVLEMCKATYQGPLVKPDMIPHNRFNWRRLEGFRSEQPLVFDKASPEIPFAEERTFYVDFELASPDYLYSSSTLKDSEEEHESNYPRYFDVESASPIQPDCTADSLIFMIGCGQVINGEWKHKVFTARTLSREGESGVVREWLEYLHFVLPPHHGHLFLNVWGPESQLLRKALRNMTATDAKAVKEIRFLNIVNMLQVVMAGCVAVRGSFSNSLKAVSKSLEQLGLLENFHGRDKKDLVSDGSDAMAVGLECAEVAYKRKLGSLSDAPKMAQIARYNEADCRDIARIVTYLRKHH